MTTGTVPPPSTITVRDLLGGGSLALVLLFLVKVYAVAHYSLTTAAGLGRVSEVRACGR